jgi:hypothetical protein
LRIGEQRHGSRDIPVSKHLQKCRCCSESKTIVLTEIARGECGVPRTQGRFGPCGWCYPGTGLPQAGPTKV